MVRRNSTCKGWKTLSAVARALSHDAVQDRACNPPAMRIHAPNAARTMP
ncbi:hypothetical protein K788_0002535 [Paraburkholderia caribensis MBA4]|uniref:Uncharacterized protein n=1 Tax=Paraburkholderia caribensis MBA4 TaxID=1323664 RepID=A0A0P0RA22_9BURK|nr:hypothetical protein K788_0002535 [Paraburkholderia caribensis MBA4]